MVVCVLPIHFTSINVNAIMSGLNALFNFAVLYLIIATLAIGNAIDQDEIVKLPGLEFNINFKQYSGFLDGGKGRKLFYWFVESESNPSNDPVLLWLNGGPGCSSLEGLFSENGPFRVQLDGKTVKKDPYNWNKFASVLYLESPVNVGFSHNTTQITDADLYNDEAVTDAKYNALVDFFSKYSQFKSNKFYITGESYAGVYIPVLTKKILERKGEHEFNLQGIAIGNGVLDLDILASSRVEYAYYHGFVGIDKWQQLQKFCCHRKENSLVSECDYPVIFPNYTLAARNKNTNCELLVGQIFLNLKMLNINIYNIYDTCDPEKTKHVDHLCVNDNFGDYLNQVNVRKALHIPDSAKKWSKCNEGILAKYLQQYWSMDKVYKDIIYKHNFTNIILFNGDIDIACDFLSTQRFLVNHMNFEFSEESKVWKVDGKLAGIVSEFKNGLKYYTVHGAGHMVPIQKPEAAESIVKELLGITQN